MIGDGEKYIYVQFVLPTQSTIMSIVLICRAALPEIEQEFSHRAQTGDHPFLFQPQKSCTVTGAPDRLSAGNLPQRPQASALSLFDSGYRAAVPLNRFFLTPLPFRSRDVQLIPFYSPNINYFTVGVGWFFGV